MSDRRVALLFGDRVAHARLAEALRGHAALWATDTVDAVEQVLAEPSTVAATVILFTPSRQRDALRAAERLRTAYPEHPVIGYVDPRTLSSQLILETGRANLADLILRDVDDSRAVLQRVLRNAEQPGLARRIAEQMSAGLPRNVRITVQFIGRHLRDPLDVPTIAAGLGISRRTLHHRLGQEGSPTAGELVSWCRVLYTVHQLSRAGAPLAAIATQLDMPSWRTVNHLLRRYLGSGAPGWRHPEAFRDALHAFHAAFARRPPAPMVCWVEAGAAVVGRQGIDRPGPAQARALLGPGGRR